MNIAIEIQGGVYLICQRYIFFIFIFFFTISPLIINFIISVIETYKYDKWQYTKIKDTSFEYSDLKAEIEKTALINSKYEYTIKNIAIYKKDSYGRATNHYRKRFLTDLEKEYNRIISAILDEHSNEFSEPFKIYVLNRYPDATVSDLKNIIYQYLNSPEVKQLNSKKITNKMELILQQFAKQNPEIGMSFNKLRCNIMLADMDLAEDISTIGRIAYQEKINENDKKEEINKESSCNQKITNSMEKDALDDF